MLGKGIENLSELKNLFVEVATRSRAYKKRLPTTL